MGKSDKVMEWVLGKPIPKPPLRRRSKSPLRNRKVIVHVETSESEYGSDITSDDSSIAKKKVRFTEDTKPPAESIDQVEGEDKESSDKKEENKAKEFKEPAANSPEPIRTECGVAEVGSARVYECVCCKAKAEKHDSPAPLKEKETSSEKSQAENNSANEKKTKQKPENKDPLKKQPDNTQAKGHGTQKKQKQNQNKNNQAKTSNDNAKQSKPNGTQQQQSCQNPLKPYNNQYTGQQPQNRGRSNANKPNRVISVSISLPELTKNMPDRIIQQSRADVVLREDVIEVPTDPRPNAFFDSKTGVLRVYHGPMYGNPFATLVPSSLNRMPLGTPPPHPGQFGGPPPIHRSSVPLGNSPLTPVQKLATPVQKPASPVQNQASPVTQSQRNSPNMPGTWPSANNNENNNNTISGSGWNNEASNKPWGEWNDNGAGQVNSPNFGGGEAWKNSPKTNNNTDTWGRGNNHNPKDDSNGNDLGNNNHCLDNNTNDEWGAADSNNQQANENSGSGWGQPFDNNGGGRSAKGNDQSNNNVGGQGWNNIRSSSKNGGKNNNSSGPSWQWNSQLSNNGVGSGWGQNQSKTSGRGQSSWENNQPINNSGNSNYAGTSWQNAHQTIGGGNNSDSWGPPANPAPWGNMSVAQSTHKTPSKNNNNSGGGWDSGNDSGSGWNANKKSGGWEKTVSGGGDGDGWNGW